ncbi:MAG TPA: response regulator [Candidatus Omnitrophota bacterium]|nr:response regulator [Candidatus Omnitrophota bacterium]HQL40758.1 response regulator [Candidatus Omnitrophota bacterium]
MERKKTILFVEDESDLRMLVAEELSGLGYHVMEADDGEEAMACFEKVIPDLIITDIVMPKMHGDELVRAVRALDQGKKIPIIVVSAYAPKEKALSGFEGVSIIEKPFSVDQLLSMVQDLLAEK